MIINPVTKGLKGSVSVPGDKSISHRSIMFGALAKGTTEVSGFLQGADCLSTISCFTKMGVQIENKDGRILVRGNGLRGLHAPDGILDCGNSGTTTRLISGILAAQPFPSVLTGDSSLCRRPMKRIITPLGMMGARIESCNDSGCAPLTIHGGSLTGIHYFSPVASAQVKSAVLLAGLYADGITQVTETALSRNHTELMLGSFGADIAADGTTVTIQPANELYAQQINVPGDISSAAYFIVAGLITANSEIYLKNVGVNPTRDGILRVCEQMGATLKYENHQTKSGEPTCDILVTPAPLRAVTIGGDMIPTLIDEIPAIALLACFADGTTVIRDAAELKAKESNRIDIVVENLRKMGADITATEDGMIIRGGSPLHGVSEENPIQCHEDHRIAMTFSIAALAADGPVAIADAELVNISYPDFYEDLAALRV